MSAAIIRRAAEWADNAPAEEGYPETAPRLREIAKEPRAPWSGVVAWAESRGMAVVS